MRRRSHPGPRAPDSRSAQALLPAGRRADRAHAARALRQAQGLTCDLRCKQAASEGSAASASVTSVKASAVAPSAMCARARRSSSLALRPLAAATAGSARASEQSCMHAACRPGRHTPCVRPRLSGMQAGHVARTQAPHLHPAPQPLLRLVQATQPAARTGRGTCCCRARPPGQQPGWPGRAPTGRRATVPRPRGTAGRCRAAAASPPPAHPHAAGIRRAPDSVNMLEMASCLSLGCSSWAGTCVALAPPHARTLRLPGLGRPAAWRQRRAAVLPRCCPRRLPSSGLCACPEQQKRSPGTSRLPCRRPGVLRPPRLPAATGIAHVLCPENCRHATAALRLFA